MELVVDANILFAALIKDSHTRHILLISSHIFYIPEFLFEEVLKYEQELCNKTGLSTVQLKELLQSILFLGNVHVVLGNEYKAFLKQAEEISPDPDDVPYIALALYKRCAIWSNDKKLKEQKNVKVYSTEDLPH